MLAVVRKPLLLAALALSSLAQAADYTVQPLPESHQAKVTVSVAAPSKEFHMPAWAPGDYQIFDYGNQVTLLHFYKSGLEVTATKGTDPNLWTIEQGADTVEYLVAESRANFGPNLRVNEDEMFVNGPGVLGWFDGHTKEEQRLRLSQPTGCQIAVALPKATDALHLQDSALYLAKDYDHLIDSPFVVSKNLRVKDFLAEGQIHHVAAYNQSLNVDLDAYAQVAAKVVEQAKALFGELPYKEYWFLLDFGGPGGGLEHRDCAKIGLRPTATAQQSVGILFHEYFHCYNVKRIRAKPLGPFDYTKPAVTGALWWLEGVTDYYADVLAERAGIDSREEFLQQMSGSFNSIARNASSLRVSADECSRRVWETRGSNGFGGMSYYTKGKVVGFALDLAIRAQSKNAHSLDDVIRDLYQECKGPSGFEESRIRELCVKYGGSSLGGFYDACVMQPGRIAIEPVLAANGFMNAATSPNLLAVADDPSADPSTRRLAAAYPAPVHK